MKRHFNTHIEGLDLQFWHDLLESRGKFVTSGLSRIKKKILKNIDIS